MPPLVPPRDEHHAEPVAKKSKTTSERRQRLLSAESLLESSRQGSGSPVQLSRLEGANTIKLGCKLTREDVRNAFWSVELKKMVRDKSQQVTNLKKWRNAYPNALSAALSRTATFPREDYVCSAAFATST